MESEIQIHETIDDNHIKSLLDERQRLQEKRHKFEETANFTHNHGNLSISA